MYSRLVAFVYNNLYVIQWGTGWYKYRKEWLINPSHKIPQCIRQISLDAPFCNTYVHISVTERCIVRYDRGLVHCGICTTGSLKNGYKYTTLAYINLSLIGKRSNVFGDSLSTWWQQVICYDGSSEFYHWYLNVMSVAGEISEQI